MLTSKNFILLASAALVISAGLTPLAHAQTAADLPPDVMGLISRRGGCLECFKKASEPGSKERIGCIGGILRSLKCDEVANDEGILRQGSRGKPEVFPAVDSNLG